MPKCCCVPLCSIRGAEHRFPKDPALRKKWLVAIRRDKFSPTPHTRVCKNHFLPEDFELPKDSVKLNATRRLKHTAVPSQFSWTAPVPVSAEKRRKRAESRAATRDLKNFLNLATESTEEVDESGDCEVPTEVFDADILDTSTSDAAQCVEAEVECPTREVSVDCKLFDCCAGKTFCDAETQTDFSASVVEFKIENLVDKPKEIQVNTGFSDYNMFMLVFNLLGDEVNYLRYYPLKQEISVKRVISPANEFLLTLVKLRCNKIFEELGIQFGISPSLASNIFITWIKFLYLKFKELDTWPSHTNSENLMRANGRQCPSTIIIDCTEIKIEKPTNPLAQQQTYSPYVIMLMYIKQCNTVKVLIGVSPTGCVMYVSDAYGGSVSDRQIFERYGIINLLKDKDIIPCDRGFNVQDLVAHKNVQVNMPAFLKGSQFTPQELKMSRSISTDRIHVERVIGLAKTYKILSHIRKSNLPAR